MTKCPNARKLCTLKAPLSKNGFYFFSHLLTCKISTIFYDATLLKLIIPLSFFECCVFKFQMASQKSDANNRISIIFIKVFIKINLMQVYNKNTHFVTRKYNINRIFIKIEYIFICVQSSLKFFNHVTCNKPIRNKF